MAGKEQPIQYSDRRNMAACRPTRDNANVHRRVATRRSNRLLKPFVGAIGMIVVGLPNGGMVNLRPMEDAVSSFGRHQLPICRWNSSLDQDNYDHPYWPPPHESGLPQLMRTIILQSARLTLLAAVPTLSAGVNRGIWKANQPVCKVPEHCSYNDAAKNFPKVLHDLEIQ
jgi:hypothetical protein